MPPSPQSLPLDGPAGGGLNVCARSPAAFDALSREFARRFASSAAVAAGDVLLYESALARAKNLEAALTRVR